MEITEEGLPEYGKEIVITIIANSSDASRIKKDEGGIKTDILPRGIWSVCYSLNTTTPDMGLIGLTPPATSGNKLNQRAGIFPILISNLHK